MALAPSFGQERTLRIGNLGRDGGKRERERKKGREESNLEGPAKKTLEGTIGFQFLPHFILFFQFHSRVKLVYN
jgi:hypothetical protein